MTNIAKIPSWKTTHPTGGTSYELAGSNIVVDVPPYTTIFHIAAEGGAVYYQPGGIASALSPGFVPENGRVIEGPLAVIDKPVLSIYGEADTIAHIQFYKEQLK